MKKLLIILCVLISCQLVSAQTGYPVPPKTDKMIFYLQRSHNKNTIIYDANLQADKKLNSDEPINVYWMRFEEGGRKADLSFIQRKAFGVKCVLKDKDKGIYSLKFNNFNKRDITLLKNTTGQYKAYVKINNENAELESVYIMSEKNALGMSIKFKYIDLNGYSVSSKKKITERIPL